jgi:hypothetical protein
MLLHLPSHLRYYVLANIEASFARCVVHVIRTCYALFTTERATQGDGRTAACPKLGAIPMGPAVCFRAAFRVDGSVRPLNSAVEVTTERGKELSIAVLEFVSGAH